MTLWQPWASLVAEGVKTVETRGREHPWRSAIGQTIAIHSALRRPFVIEATEYADWCERAGWPSLPLGAVLATVRLVDVVPMLGVGDVINARPPARPPFVVDTEPLGGALCLATDESMPAGVDIEDQRPFGDFTPGRFALLFENVTKLPEPVWVRGWQGLWEWAA